MITKKISILLAFFSLNGTLALLGGETRITKINNNSGHKVKIIWKKTSISTKIMYIEKNQELKLEGNVNQINPYIIPWESYGGVISIIVGGEEAGAAANSATITEKCCIRGWTRQICISDYKRGASSCIEVGEDEYNANTATFSININSDTTVSLVKNN